MWLAVVPRFASVLAASLVNLESRLADTGRAREAFETRDSASTAETTLNLKPPFCCSMDMEPPVSRKEEPDLPRAFAQARKTLFGRPSNVRETVNRVLLKRTTRSVSRDQIYGIAHLEQDSWAE